MRRLKKILNGIGKVMRIILTILIIGGGSSLLSAEYHNSRLGDDLIYSAIPKYGTADEIMFTLFVVSLVVLKWCERSEKDGLKDWVTGRKKRIRVLGISALFLIGVLVDTQWVNYYTLDGIISVELFRRKEYSWGEAEKFVLSANRDKELKFIIHMKDGNKCSYKEAHQSKLFSEKFENRDYDYLPWMAGKLKDAGVLMEIKREDTLIYRLDYDGDKECLQKIIDVYRGA